ncbi:hypothetical protein NKH77_20610 [Streptomyces sp. M19]
MAGHRRERAGPGRRAAGGAQDAREVVARLIGGAERSVAVVLPRSGELEEAVVEALARAGTGTAPAPAAGSAPRRAPPVPGGPRGGRRTAAVRTARAGHRPGARLRGGPPRCEVRVTDGDLPEAVMVDGRAAWVRLGPERQDPRASLVRDRATVRALDMMFIGTWAGAVALARYPHLGGRLRVDSARRILECLRAGHTDEVAARQLQVSLRTYRRYVAEIMRELGASSRFQAGVRAVELGLLPGRR